VGKLSDIKVIDLSVFLPGPMLTMMTNLPEMPESLAISVSLQWKWLRSVMTWNYFPMNNLNRSRIDLDSEMSLKNSLILVHDKAHFSRSFQ
jgi:hypothetical protein